VREAVILLFQSHKKGLTGEFGALCALLSIWICVIIFSISGIGPQRPGAEAVAVKNAPVLVVDAGHGGMDGGAVAADGTLESQINLEIALRLRDLARFTGVSVQMTRVSQELDYPAEAETVSARKKWDTRRRVEQINEAGGVLISIHQNFYPTAQPSGMQVLYAAGESSRALAELMQQRLNMYLLPENRRVAVPADKNIYIMSHVRDPAILVECGFLSNAREAKMLSAPEYQKKLAAVLLAGFLEYTGDESA